MELATDLPRTVSLQRRLMPLTTLMMAGGGPTLFLCTYNWACDPLDSRVQRHFARISEGEADGSDRWRKLV